MDNNKKDKVKKDIAEKLAQKDAKIIALKKNINFKKLVFFKISLYFLWSSPFSVKIF